jgi:hypothetical protein
MAFVVGSSMVGLDSERVKELNNMEIKEQFEVKILNRFAVLGNLDANVAISRASENIRQYHIFS